MKNLILVPTVLEANHLLGREMNGEEQSHGIQTPVGTWALCGVGPAAAAFSAQRWIAALAPERLILAGIGGAFPQSALKPGQIHQAESEVFADLGFQTPERFVNLDAMGLPVLQQGMKTLGCTYPCHLLDEGASAVAFATVSRLTTCPAQAALFYTTYEASIENMEGAGVAMVCAFHGLPFCQVRSVSNLVGPRDPSTWLIAEPLRRLGEWLNERLS